MIFQMKIFHISAVFLIAPALFLVKQMRIPVGVKIQQQPPGFKTRVQWA